MSCHEAWYEPLDQITTFLLLPLPAPHPPTFSSATRPTIILLQSQSVSAIYLKWRLRRLLLLLQFFLFIPHLPHPPKSSATSLSILATSFGFSLLRLRFLYPKAIGLFDIPSAASVKEFLIVSVFASTIYCFEIQEMHLHLLHSVIGEKRRQRITWGSTAE